jgi:hypothetical protein
MIPPTLPSDEQVRRLAAEILDRDEYAAYRIDEEAWLAFFERLAHWLDALSGRVMDLSVTSPLLYWCLIGTLLVAALLLLGHVAWSLRTVFIAAAPAPPDSDRPSTRDWLNEAERLARAGRFLEAARRLQHACLERLLTVGVIELSRSDPNRVLRRRLAEAPLDAEQRAELVELLDRLETHLFRDSAADAGLYESWRQLHARLRLRVPA